MNCKISNHKEELVWVLFKQLYWDIPQFIYYTIPLLILNFSSFKHFCLCIFEKSDGGLYTWH